MATPFITNYGATPLKVTAVGGNMGEGDEPVYYDQYGRRVVDTNAQNWASLDGPQWTPVVDNTTQGMGFSGSDPVHPKSNPEYFQTQSLTDILPEEFHNRDQYNDIQVPGGTDPFIYLGMRTPSNNPNEFKPDYFSTNTRDFIGPGRRPTTSIWGHDREVRDAAIKIGERLGLSREQTFEAATLAAAGDPYTEASSPLHIIQSIADQQFKMAGQPSAQLFTAEQLSQSGQQAQSRQDQFKASDPKWYDDVIDFIRVPAIFAGLIATAGAISGAVAGAGAASAGANAGLVGGQMASNELAGLAFAEAGAGGSAATVTGLEAAATAASQAAGTGSFAAGVDAGLEHLDIGIGDAVNIVKKAYGVFDEIVGDVGGDEQGFVAQSGESVVPEQDDDTAPDVLRKAFEFFGGGLPFRPSGAALRSSRGEEVYGASRGIINSARDFGRSQRG